MELAEQIVRRGFHAAQPLEDGPQAGQHPFDVALVRYAAAEDIGNQSGEQVAGVGAPGGGGQQPQPEVDPHRQRRAEKIIPPQRQRQHTAGLGGTGHAKAQLARADGVIAGRAVLQRPRLPIRECRKFCFTYPQN